MLLLWSVIRAEDCLKCLDFVLACHVSLFLNVL